MHGNFRLAKNRWGQDRRSNRGSDLSGDDLLSRRGNDHNLHIEVFMSFGDVDARNTSQTVKIYQES